MLIIGILAAIAIPTFLGQQQSAHKASAQSWVANTTKLVYSYSLINGTMPTTLAAAGAPDAGDLVTRYYAGTDSFCVSAFWSGAGTTSGFGPTGDTYKVVYSPTRLSLVAVNPASFCVNAAG